MDLSSLLTNAIKRQIWSISSTFGSGDNSQINEIAPEWGIYPPRQSSRDFFCNPLRRWPPINPVPMVGFPQLCAIRLVGPFDAAHVPDPASIPAGIQAFPGMRALGDAVSERRIQEGDHVAL
ncbi:hypothetical protein [Rhodovulum sp. YEN HP10]|uniref:hypothetical protein n=1 Tax=Rhodovulum sp. HP10 TaxID=3387397 RepID=UPI0039DF3678